jgi:hypothetical protein
MSCPNSRFRIETATAEHSPSLLKILESGAFPGAVEVLYTRRPDAWLSLQREGEKVEPIVIIDRRTDQVCGMAAASLRTVFIDGQYTKAAYLSSLKCLPEYRGNFNILPQGYAWFHDKFAADTDLFYTTILDDNLKAVKLLERKRRNMPRYKYQGRYTVSFIKTNLAQRHSAHYHIEPANQTTTNDILAFINQYQKQYQFGTVLAQNSFPLANLRENDFFALRNQAGSIVAACACWDQRHYKQYIPLNYHGSLKIIAKLPLAQFWGYPKIPQIGTIANYFSIAFLAILDDDPEILDVFLRKLSLLKKEYDFFALGFHQSHPLAHCIRLKHIKYGSRFYLVDYLQRDDRPWLLDQPLNLECALL